MKSLEKLLKKSLDTVKHYLLIKDYVTAEKILEQTIKVTDKHIFVQLLSLVKTNLEKKEEAEILYKNLCNNYNNADDFNNYALFLKNENRFHESIEYSTKSIELNPEKALLWSNHALTLTRIDKYDDALNAINKAIDLNPNEWFFYANKACTLAEIGKYNDALVCFKKAIEFPNCGDDVYIDMFFALAFMKRYQESWYYYERRYNSYKNLQNFMYKNNLQKPENINKEMKFVIFCEQGSGDNLMYLRFLEEFQKIYYNSYFFCPENFITIMNEKITWKNQIDSDTKYGISLLSLPYYLNVSEIPEPYKISVTRNKNSDKKKIGIVWSGNPAHPMDYQRSTYFKHFAENLNFEKHTIYSFQKDLRARKYVNQDELVNYSEDFEKYPIIDLSEQLHDIAKTAELLSDMDLLISVDTLMAHIAGSVGIPVGLIVSDKPDWRWGREGIKSCWYENITIFRKEKTQSFKETIGSVVKYFSL